MKIQKSKPTIIDSGTMADLFKDFEFFAVKNPFVFNDGGRAEAGFKGSTGDCVTRAIAIAMRLPYKQVYKELTEAIKTFSETKRCKVAKKIKKEKDYSPRDGVYKKVYHD